jgi:ABC-type multidrug transport system ATPase subunit
VRPANEPLTIGAGPLGELHAKVVAWPRTVVVQTQTVRTELALPGELILDGIKLSARLVVCPGKDRACPSIGAFRDKPIPLKVGGGVWLGREVFSNLYDVHLHDPSVSMRHCRLVRQSGTSHYWIVDNDSEHGTYVNKKRIVACRLSAGDLVQIGPFAWIFSGQSFGDDNGSLDPVRSLPGVQLAFENVGVGTRGQRGPYIEKINLQIDAGEFVAITGQSGSGKSTLVRAILEGSYRGLILADGHDVKDSREWFSSIVGYVSQKDVIHSDLTARQAVEFNAQLRECSMDDECLKQLLRQVELSEDTSKKPCRFLSGGESKRVRTAAELIESKERPGLLILDEPASGLDHGREVGLMRLLRTLSYRGCTVLVVTHSLHHLEDFDRVLVLREGSRVFWGTPSELSEEVPSGDLRGLDLAQVKEHTTSALDPQPCEPAKPVQLFGFAGRFDRVRRQFRILLNRDLALLAGDWEKRLIVPLAVLPIFFALSIGLAVKPTDLHVLGFLSILSCIWMGASLSLMSIVNERDIFEHERLLFLRVSPYVLSKTVVLWLVSAIQTSFFVGLLSFIRSRRGGEAMLFGLGWCVVVLLLVGFAAVGLGLLISALSGKSKPLAGFILPLVMMVQIVFSVQVAGKSEGSLADAYGEFTPWWCKATLGCSRRAQHWAAIVERGPFNWKCDRCPSSSAPDPGNDALENSQRPHRWAALASYFTISRYGDIALRRFAYWRSDFEGSNRDAKEYRYSYWWIEALGMLGLFSIGLPGLAVAVLCRQERILVGIKKTANAVSVWQQPIVTMRNEGLRWFRSTSHS